MDPLIYMGALWQGQKAAEGEEIETKTCLGCLDWSVVYLWLSKSSNGIKRALRMAGCRFLVNLTAEL